jgi:hypothetical protein
MHKFGVTARFLFLVVFYLGFSGFAAFFTHFGALILSKLDDCHFKLVIGPFYIQNQQHSVKN